MPDHGKCRSGQAEAFVFKIEYGIIGDNASDSSHPNIFSLIDVEDHTGQGYHYKLPIKIGWTMH